MKSNRKSKDPSARPRNAVLYLISFLLGLCILLVFLNQNDLNITTAALLWAIGIGVLLAIEHFLSNTLTAFRFLKLSAIVLLSSLFAYYLFGMNLQAKFGLLDDHEIIFYLGEDGKMALADAPTLLIEETEVGQFGEYPRFRPSYYSVRIVETWLWGNNPAIWYLSRLIMVTLIIIIAWYVLAEIIGFLPAALTTAFIFTWPAWGDIFSRLGPGETYAAVGLAFFFLGSYLILKNLGDGSTDARLYVGWFLVALGTALAVGSKENFLVLMPIILILLITSLYYRRTLIFALLSTLLIFAYSGVIAYAILLTLAKSGADIYGRSTGLIERLNPLRDIFLSIENVFLLCIIFFLIIMLLWSTLAKKGNTLRRPTCLAFIIVVGSYLLLFIAQIIFYAGNWPTGGRYDFPGLLYGPIVFITIIWYILVLLQQLGISPAVSKGLRAGLLVGATLLIVLFSYADLREIGFHNVRLTQGFEKRLDNVSTVLTNEPDSALVIESHFVRDYEAIISWGRFLRNATGIKNPIFLRIHEYSSDTAETELYRVLTAYLEGASTNGELGFSPIHELDNFGSNCYSLHLSGHTDTGCKDVQ